MRALGTHGGGHKPLSAHLRFLKDVLYGLHGFAREDSCFSNQKTCQENMFSHAARSLRPKPQKALPEPSKRDPKTLLWDLWRHVAKASKTGHLKKSLLSPGTSRGICCFRALGPGNGTPIIYRYMYILESSRARLARA